MKLIVSTTLDNKKNAQILARKIIEEELGTCAQITEIESIYKWKSKIETAKEFKIDIKTDSSKYKELEKFIINNHKYELPEIIAVKIKKGYKKYLEWIK